jgi:hypothetical protein
VCKVTMGRSLLWLHRNGIANRDQCEGM